MYAIIPALPDIRKESVPSALQALLKHGMSTEQTAAASDDLLFKTLGLKPATAAYLAAVDGLEVRNDYWICVSPVICQAEHNALFIVKDESLELSPALNDELFKLVSIYLATDGYCLERGASGRWYLRYQSPTLFKADPLELILGQAVFKHVAELPELASGHKLFVELQMLLEQHKVYQKCQTAVNALWFWGEGALQPFQQCKLKSIISNEGLAKSIADFHGLTYLPFPKKINFQKADLFFYKDLWSAKAASDQLLYQAKLTELEIHFFEPCLKALRNGSLEQFILIQPEGQTHTMTSKALQPWWKRVLLR